MLRHNFLHCNLKNMCRDNFSGCNHMQRICEETTFQVVIIDNMCRDDFSGSNHREYV